MKKLLLTFKIFILLTTSSILTSCSEEDIDNITEIAKYTLLYSAIYSHYDGSNYYYRVRNCNSQHVYFGNHSRVYTQCRYYSDYNGYYVYTPTYYNQFDIYY